MANVVTAIGFPLLHLFNVGNSRDFYYTIFIRGTGLTSNIWAASQRFLSEVVGCFDNL